MSIAGTAVADQHLVTSECLRAVGAEEPQDLPWLVKAKWILEAEGGAVAAPMPFPGLGDQAASHGVGRDVAERLPQMTLSQDIHHERAILDEVTRSGAPGPGVAATRETPVELAHSLR